MKLFKDDNVKIVDDNSPLVQKLKVQGWKEEVIEVEKPKKTTKKKAK